MPWAGLGTPAQGKQSKILSDAWQADSNNLRTISISLSPLSLAIRTSLVGLGLAHGAVLAITIMVDSNQDDGSGIYASSSNVSLNNSIEPKRNQRTPTCIRDDSPGFLMALS